jgi:hypothetical protein
MSQLWITNIWFSVSDKSDQSIDTNVAISRGVDLIYL